MLRHDWWCMAYLVALLTLALLWPWPLRAGGGLPTFPKHDLCQWGCLRWGNCQRQTQERGIYTAKDGTPLHWDWQTVSATGRATLTLYQWGQVRGRVRR